MTAPAPLSPGDRSGVVRRLRHAAGSYLGLKLMAVVLALLLWVAVAARTGRLRLAHTSAEATR